MWTWVDRIRQVVREFIGSSHRPESTKEHPETLALHARSLSLNAHHNLPSKLWSRVIDTLKINSTPVLSPVVNGRTLQLKFDLFDRLFSTSPHWTLIQYAFLCFSYYTIFKFRIQIWEYGINFTLFVSLIFRNLDLFSGMNVYYDYLYIDFWKMSEKASFGFLLFKS